MPHTVESTITYSAADYARGAVDLIDDEPATLSPVLPNTTIVEKAATLVREMAPKFIETIVSHLVPVSSPPHSEAAPGQPPHQFHPQQQTFVSPPVETVVVVEVPANTSIPTSSHTGDTVSNGAKENLCN
jgi:hypothetical protein